MGNNVSLISVFLMSKQ